MAELAWTLMVRMKVERTGLVLEPAGFPYPLGVGCESGQEMTQGSWLVSGED